MRSESVNPDGVPEDPVVTPMTDAIAAVVNVLVAAPDALLLPHVDALFRLARRASDEARRAELSAQWAAEADAHRARCGTR